MALEVILDRSGREIAFEPLLDDLLELFSPTWVLPARMVTEPPYHRCEVRRWEIGRAAKADSGFTRRHADLLVDAAMHDRCRSGINQLIRPLVTVLGHRWTQEQIIRFVRTGSNAQKAGAAMAWFWSRPPLRYASGDDLRNGSPTPESRAARDALADMRAEYQEAVLTAFLACEDLGTRADAPALRPELAPPTRSDVISLGS
ncbi:hypothetical protein [Streptomyces sp. NPDC002763]|uniref:hypothetical protein n=1 Tax=Streptomyces sp. NPDC002763 TaxID=3154427 RepID=UPI003325ABC2